VAAITAPKARLRERGLGPELIRISPKNSAAPTAKATTSLSTLSACSSANRSPAQPEARLSKVEMTSDTSSRKPKAST
jgi:hypothetical protein